MKIPKNIAAMLALLPVSAFAEDEIVVTANGIESPYEETGQAITVIDKEQLEKSQSISVGDILRTVPGVSVARTGGVGGQTSVFIRGGESSQTLVLIDGVRVNDPSSPNAAFDFGALLTGNIESVEILRGSNSIIWGSQAIGGVVNIRNATPASGALFTSLAEYGANDSFQARANVAGGADIISGSIGAAYYRTDGISALNAGTERDGYENFSVNARLGIAVSDGFGVDVRGYYNDGRVEFDDPFGATADTFPQTDNEQFIGYIGANHRALGGRFKGRLAYSRTDLDRRGSEPDVAFSFNENRLQGVIDRFEYLGSFDVTKNLSLILGAEHERSSAHIFFPANGGTEPDAATSKVGAIFGQVILRPVSGLSVTGGVRHDDFDQYGGQTTFGVNFSYSPNDGITRIRGSYGEGFRAPTLTEALLPFGNADLKPETAKSYDIGVEHSIWDGRISASATYFRRTSNDTIIFSFDSFQSENIARTRAEGVELAVNIRPGDHVNITAHYSLVDATNRTQDANFGNDLARRPHDSASLGVEWQSPWSWSMGGNIIIVGDSFDDLANNARLDGYILASVHASVPLNDRIDIYGRVENIFDEIYETVRGYGNLGRNAYVGVRLKY